jgi:uncharacterized protein YraI
MQWNTRRMRLCPRGSHIALWLAALFVILLLIVPVAGAQTAVVTRNANLRTGPGTTHTKITQLQPPDELVLVEPTAQQGWYHVRTPSGTSGWISGHSIRITQEPSPPPVDTTPAGGPPVDYRGCPPEGSATQTFRQQSNRLKNRVARPAASDIDTSITLDAILQPADDRNRFDSSQGASIVAFVVNVKPGGNETVNCGETEVAYIDTHIELIGDPQRTDKTRRVIVEVTPRWRAYSAAQHEDWSTSALKQRYMGRWVRFTGWMFWDFEHAGNATNTASAGATNVWRATAWEIHPITEMQLCPNDSPQGC